MGADVRSTLAAMFQRGSAASVGALSPSALLSQHGGRYRAARRAPPTLPDPVLWPAEEFALLVEAFRVTGFRPANSWYLNDAANIAYAVTAPDARRLRQPCCSSTARGIRFATSAAADLAIRCAPAAMTLP